MYTDDTVLFYEIDFKGNFKQTIQLVNEELDMFGHWCWANSLTVNTDKTKFMLFKSKYYSGTGLEDKLPPLFLNGDAGLC